MLTYAGARYDNQVLVATKQLVFALRSARWGERCVGRQPRTLKCCTIQAIAHSYCCYIELHEELPFVTSRVVLALRCNAARPRRCHPRHYSSSLSSLVAALKVLWHANPCRKPCHAALFDPFGEWSSDRRLAQAAQSKALEQGVLLYFPPAHESSNFSFATLIFRVRIILGSDRSPFCCTSPRHKSTRELTLQASGTRKLANIIPIMCIRN